tara:strand:- start:420 stop:578 length:159 start_codon:yes stop_codon:yes gene_type:complete
LAEPEAARVQATPALAQEPEALHRLGRARFPELPAYEELASEEAAAGVLTFD